jgi:hypothetical protein
MAKAKRLFLGILVCTASLLCTARSMGAETMAKEAKSTDVLKPGERITDRRVTEIKTYNTPWTFNKPSSMEEWLERKDRIRRKILISCGLWPMPEKGPLNVEVFERKEHEDYTVEKVLLETFPGYYATGNLYRPKQKTDHELRKLPAVICPHGHWPNGRFENSDKCSVPGRAINFARQGYVCFTYDMVGYGDNKAFLEHNFGGKRELLWGISPAGLQLYTSIRALDFMQTLPDVEPRRLGVTGASGGGTQTFLLAAVDDRVRVAAPVNMISAHMQGGCKCENPPGLRLDINNMDIGAAMAPREMIMVCATGDWTKNTPEVEFPAIRSVYELYNDTESVDYHQVDAEHNYNKESREAVYKWFGRFFYPGRSETAFIEKDFIVDPTEDLYVFAHHPIPANSLKAEDLFASLRETRDKQVWDYVDKFKASYQSILGLAYKETLAVEEPDFGDIKTENLTKAAGKGVTTEKFLLTNEKTGQKVPAILWTPSRLNPKRADAAVLLVHREGKGGLVNQDGSPGAELNAHLAAGTPVLSVDCLGTGEFVQDASWTARVDAEVKDGFAHFATYNLTDAAGRVQDILLAETYLAKRFGKPAKIAGLSGAGGWVLLAHGLAGHSAGTKADLSGLDFKDDHAFVEDLFIPNLRKVGDFVSSIILGGSRRVEWTGCADGAVDSRLTKALERAKQPS